MAQGNADGGVGEHVEDVGEEDGNNDGGGSLGDYGGVDDRSVLKNGDHDEVSGVGD